MRPSCSHVFISHAHRDHTHGFNSKQTLKYSTNATAKIFEATSGKKLTGITKLSYGEKIKVGGFEVTAYDSGHVLGSTMFKIETDEGVVVYTGDINYVDTLVTSAVQPLPCDVLITESTYGKAGYVFPARNHVYRSMIRWVVEKVKEGSTPVFYVYTVGKAQEIVRLMNEFTELEVVVHPTIAKVNDVYLKSDVELEAVEENVGMNPEKCVVVYPSYATAPAAFKNQSPAAATGWAVRFRNREDAFPLSSHADFPQLLSFIRDAKPKTVLTCFGSCVELASNVRRRLGINAKPLQALESTKKLTDFEE